MGDFEFLFSVAFSGADLSRALWLGTIASLLCTEKFGPFRMTFLMFLIDRAWPFADMAFAGYGMKEIAASVAYAVESLPQDMTYHVFRFGGLYAICSFTYTLRVMLHRASRNSVKLTLPY